MIPVSNWKGSSIPHNRCHLGSVPSFRLVFLLLGVGNSIADMALKQVKYHTETSEKTLNSSLKFVEKLLHAQFQENDRVLHWSGVSAVLNTQTQRVKLFVVHSRKEILVFPRPRFIQRTTHNVFSYGSVLGRIFNAAGSPQQELHVFLSVRDMIWRPAGTFPEFTHQKACCIRFSWRFFLHQLLGVKLSFLKLYFSSGPFDCEMGHVVITNVAITVETTKTTEFIFCGQYPEFSIYPQDRRVQLDIRAENFIYHTVSLCFTVQDKDRVANVKTSQLSHKTPIAIHLLNNNKLLMTFLIQVEKNRFILIKILHSSLLHVVFDGPAFGCNMLNMTYNMYRTSTFQSLLQILTNRNFTLSKWSCHFSQGSLVRSQLVNLTQINSTTMELPNTEFALNPVSILVASHVGYQVNLTVQHIFYKGLESMACIFGGLSVGNIKQTQHKDIVTLCKSHNYTEQPKRSYISSSSYLQLILYWYPAYSNISVVLLLSETKCQTVALLVPKLAFMCKDYSSVNCNSYLKNITHHINMTMSPTTTQAVHFDLPKGECVVLQFLHKWFNTQNMKHKHFSLDNMFDLEARQIRYEIKGFFQCNPFSTGEALSLKGQFVNFSQDGRRQIGCHRHNPLQEDLERQLLFSRVYSWQKTNDQNFFLFAKTAALHSRHFTQISIDLFFHTKSWLDIKIESLDSSISIYEGFVENYIVENALSSSKLSSSVTNISLLPYDSGSSYALAFSIRKNTTNQFQTKTSLWIQSVRDVFGPKQFGQQTYSVFYLNLPNTLHWSSTTMLKGNTQWFVSLPGQQNNVTATLPDNKTDLTLVWIDDIYERLHLPFDSKTDKVHSQYCSWIPIKSDLHCLVTSDHTLKCQCYALEIPQAAQAFYFIVESLNISSLVRKKLSWKDASLMCSALKGLLPHFDSMGTFNEFLSFVKLHQITTVGAAYIGIRYQRSKVQTSWSHTSARNSRQIPADLIRMQRCFMFCAILLHSKFRSSL